MSYLESHGASSSAQFLFSEVEHLIDSGTYEPRNQGDTLTIKWKLQPPQ